MDLKESRLRSSLPGEGLSRRQFLWLAGVILLTGCQTTQSAPSGATATLLK
jgi:hypothetical protein